MKNTQKSFFILFVTLSLILSLNTYAFQDGRFLIPPDNVEENSLKGFDFDEGSETEIGRKNENLIQSLLHTYKDYFINSAFLRKDGLSHYMDGLRSLFVKYPQLWNSLNIYAVNSASDTLGKYTYCSLENNSKFQVVFIKPSSNFSIRSMQYEITSKFYEDCTFFFNQEQSFLFQFIISSRGNFLVLNRSSLEKHILKIENDKIKMEIHILQNLRDNLRQNSVEQDQYIQALEIKNLNFMATYLSKENRDLSVAMEKVQEDLVSFRDKKIRLLDERDRKLAERAENEEIQKTSAELGASVGGTAAGVACSPGGPLAASLCSAIGSLIGNEVGNAIARVLQGLF